MVHTEINKIHETLRRLGVCEMVRGDENDEQLLRLFVTPQGLEFCQKTGFPSPEMARKFQGVQTEDMGVYIDAGKITLHNPSRAILIGDTHATLEFDDRAEMRHEVAVMQGATARGIASNWAVVFTQNIAGEINIKSTDNAIVM